MSIAKTIRMNQLFAFYQSLLTQKQQQMLELYYEEDYSLAEIATYYQISRQAVHDNLKRAENLLEDYETKLQLLARRQQRIIDINQREIGAFPAKHGTEFGKAQTPGLPHGRANARSRCVTGVMKGESG